MITPTDTHTYGRWYYDPMYGVHKRKCNDCEYVETDPDETVNDDGPDDDEWINRAYMAQAGENPANKG